MKPFFRRALFVFLGAVLIGAGLGIGYWLGQDSSKPTELDQNAHEDKAEPAFWTCSMDPQIRMPQKGQCPICGMDLIEVFSDGRESSGRRLVVNARDRERMRIRTAPVERRFAEATIRLVGRITYDETRLAHVTAWVPGRIDQLFVDYTGVTVRQGDHMVYLYSPELYSAQEELLQAKRAIGQISDQGALRGSTEDTLASARAKLQLLGLTDVQITEIEERGTPAEHMTIYAPAGGLVIDRNALEGMYVQTGTRIFTIADLSRVWVQLDAYESDLAWLRYGQEVTFETEASPGEPFRGTISFIDPFINPKTRTVKVRVIANNESGRLKPDMFVRARVRSRVAAHGQVMDPSLVGKWISPMHPEIVKDEPGDCDVCGMKLVPAESLGYISEEELASERPLVIPVTAALRTGKRAVVYVEVPGQEEPTYEGREVILGPRAGDFYIVRHGLAENERVVVEGNFKIDSALQIQARPSMMNPEGVSGGSTAHDHGGMKPGGSMPGPKVDLPASVSADLQQVERQVAAVEEALASSEAASIQFAFSGLYEKVEGLKEDRFPEDSRAAWRELAMLLLNVAFEGRESSQPERWLEIDRDLHAIVARLRSQLGTHPEAARPTRFDAPTTLREGIVDLWSSYRALQAALAADDSSVSRDAARRIVEGFESIDPGTLSAEGSTLWHRLRADGLESATAAAEVDEIADRRAAFETVSHAMQQIFERFEVSTVSPVHLVQCPMAFEGRGATWLQPGREIENPYFGSRMLRCGSVIETIREGREEDDDGR